jgi:hypothetical protein
MMGKTACKRIKARRRSIAWKVTYNSTTNAAQLSGVARWRENIKCTELHGFARWRGKTYSYWLNCTHDILIISTVLSELSSNLETRELMTVARVCGQFTTESRNHERDMPNYRVQSENLEGKKQRSCGEIQVEYTGETGNCIETRKR